MEFSNETKLVLELVFSRMTTEVTTRDVDHDEDTTEYNSFKGYEAAVHDLKIIIDDILIG